MYHAAGTARLTTTPLTFAALALTTLLGCASVGGAQPSQVSTRPVAAVAASASDFDGDGIDDVVIGTPWDTRYGRYDDVGSVSVRYAPRHGSGRSVTFDDKTPGIADTLRLYPSLLGNVLATGDFDQDGYADMVMSLPGFDEPDPAVQRINVGAVVVVYGTAHGLDPVGSQHAKVWSQDSPGVQGVSEDDDDFGSSLAVGDFDGDGFLDLAVGAVGEGSHNGGKRSGGVTVLYGGRNGLTPRDQVVTQDSPGIQDSAERGDAAASALAAGDFNGDGVADLAMGVDLEDLGTVRNAGAVNIVYGRLGVGLTGRGDRFVNRSLPAVEGEPTRGDRFGSTLAVGDFNGDRVDDLAIGAPDESVDGEQESGTVTTLLGRPSGLGMGTARTVSLTSIDPSTESRDALFGLSLAAGDVDGDGRDELAVGSPGFEANAGRVDVLAGSDAGLSARAQVLRSRDFSDDAVADPVWSFGGRFGATLGFGAYDAVPGEDLLVGFPGEDVVIDGKRSQSAGAVLLAPAENGRVGTSRSQWLHQGAFPFGGQPAPGERFGAALPGSTMALFR